MKTSELIKQLKEVLNEVGDIDVVITGQYAAITPTIWGIATTDEKFYSGEEGKPVCLIDTDLMTG